jgi:hypothetical protein
VRSNSLEIGAPPPRPVKQRRLGSDTVIIGVPAFPTVRELDDLRDAFLVALDDDVQTIVLHLESALDGIDVELESLLATFADMSQQRGGQVLLAHLDVPGLSTALVPLRPPALSGPGRVVRRVEEGAAA